MANLTTVNLTSGVPSGPAGPGIVSTLDNLIGVAGTPVTNVQTIQGIAGMTAVTVNGAVTASGTVAATQSGAWTVSVSGTVTVSGTVAATQSGTWNINNISGTISLPTGAATSAKQPALGTAGTPSVDVITVQGAALMTALKVDGSAVVQPVSGTITVGNASIPVTQSGGWTVAVSGTVAVSQSGTWSQRILGNTGAILDFSSAQNITAPANCLLVGAEFNTVPTTIVTGNASPLQMDSSANLLVNVKTSVLPTGASTSALQPTNAAQGSTTSGQTGHLAMGAVTTANPSYTNGQTSPLSLDPTGALRVNVIAGSGGGGTASSFGSAFPGTGTAIGVKDSTGVNMTNLKANASNALVVDGSAVTQPVSGTFWQATQPVSIAAAVTVAQATAANLNATVTGTVAATQSGTWNITNISGTISLPTGAATAALQPTNVTIGSTTAGQSGNLAMGAVTTAAPTYVTGQSNILSLTTAGALRVDNSAVTQPVSGTFWQATQPVSGTVTVTQATAANLNATVTGTVAATQSGTWNINNISGTISLPTGAATSANQPTAAGQGSTTSGQTGTLGMGAVTTAAPTYTNGQTSPFSLDTAGNLRVNIMAGAAAGGTSSNFNATFPTAGTAVGAEYLSSAPTLTSGQMVALQTDINGNLKVNIQSGGGTGGTSSTFGAAYPGVGTAIGAKDNTGTNMVALNVDASGNLKVNVAAGGAAGGTSSSFGAAVPATGTAAGFSDGTNMQLAHVWDGDSGAGTQWTQGVLLKTPASGGAVDIGVAGTPLRVDPTGTTTQPVSGTVTVTQSTAANLNATVTGSVSITGTTTVSGTVTANQGGAPWTVKPDGTAWALTGTSANVNVSNASIAVTGTFWQATQPISAASLPLPSGAATSANQPSNAALGSTTSGQTGTLALGAVTTAAPTYTTAQTNALSLTTAGGLRVDGSAVTQPVSGTFWQTTQPVSIAAAVTVVQPTAANLNATITGTVAATQSGTWNITNISGTISLPTGAATAANQPTAAAIGSTTSGQTGNLAMGAVTTAAPSYTTATTNNLSLTTAGALRVDGSAVTQPVSGTVTVTQATAANLNATVTGSVSITGTPTVTVGNASLAVTQSGNWTARIVGNAGATVDAVIGNATAPTNMIATGGVFNTTKPTLTTGQSAAFQVNSSGIQLMDLSLTGANATAIKVDGSAVTQPVSIAAAVTVAQATAANLNATVTGTVTANQGGNWTARIVGNTGATLDVSAGQNVAMPTNMLVVGAEFNTTPTTIASGNASPLQLDSAGNLKVNIQAGAAAGGTSSNFGSAFPTAGTAIGLTTGTNMVAWSAASNYGTSPGTIAVPAVNAFVTNTVTVSGTITANQGTSPWLSRINDGTNSAAIKAASTAAVAADPALVVAVSPNNSVAVTGTFWQTTQPVSIAANVTVVGTGTFATQSTTSGDVASGTADSGNPVKGGGVARTTNPTAVSDGQRVNAIFDKLGKQITVGAIRNLKGVQKTSITVATETTIVTAGAAGVFQDLYGLILANLSATGVNVVIKDATAGTTRITFYLPANDTRGFTVPVDSAIVQATAANNWTATVSSAVTSIEVTAMYVSNT